MGGGPPAGFRGCALAVGLLALASLTTHSGCATRNLVTRFNSGLLESSGDPNHDPTQRRRTLVKELVVHEMMDGFFTQGSPDGAVVRWLAAAQAEPHAFVFAVHAHALAAGNDLGVVSVGAPKSFERFAGAETPDRRFASLGQYWRARAPLTAGRVCSGKKLLTEPAGKIVDALRFDAAIERAGSAVTAIAIERLVNLADVLDGARLAFAELTSYLGRRKWQRRFDRHVNGVVIKGGASTGLYSAGIVWVALNLIDQCLADPTCSESAVNPRFTLASGTSTGAMVAVAVDLFNTATVRSQRTLALDNLANWFTCLGAGNLYCVREGGALEMLRHQTGLVEFDGIQKLLTENVGCESLGNHSELILNTVDFRTGNIFDLSDQNELRSPNDVVQAAIASAVLPFVAKPVPHLPVDYDADHYEQTYLDGGIRSELPILPLVRRGAERVLVVSSSNSVTSEAKNLRNGMNIAIRFIDISTGGVTESEIQHAERQVESTRLAEIDNCQNASTAKIACGGNLACIDAFCRGDWDDVCDPDAPRPANKSRSVLDLTNRRLASLWDTRSFFRDETEVEGLHGYDFDPTKQRRLFLAGAEAARVRCAEIADLLEMPVAKLGAKIVDWCTPALPPVAQLCKKDHSTNTLSDCGAPRVPASTQSCR